MFLARPDFTCVWQSFLVMKTDLKSNSLSADWKKVARGFDRLSPVYDLLAQGLSLGSLHRAERIFIKMLLPCKNILMPGAGSAYILKFLYEQGFQGNVDCIDISSGMLDLARKTLYQDYHTRVNFIHANILDYKFSRPYDAIVTNFFLDVFSEIQLNVLIGKLSTQIKPGAYWLVTDFNISKNSRHRIWQKILVQSLYRFFGYICNLPGKKLLDIPALLNRHGWQQIKRNEILRGLIHSQIFTISNPAS